MGPNHPSHGLSAVVFDCIDSIDVWMHCFKVERIVTEETVAYADGAIDGVIIRPLSFFMIHAAGSSSYSGKMRSHGKCGP